MSGDSEKDQAEDPLARLKKAMSDAKSESEKPSEPEVDPLSFKTIKDKAADNKFVGGFFKGLYHKYKFVKNTYDTAEVIWNSKITAALTLGASYLAKKYWKASKWAFLKYSMDNDGEYNKKRGAVAGVALLTFTAVAGAKIVPFTVKTTFDAVVVEGFSYKGTSVFSKPNWVSSEDNILNVFSCKKYPCQGEIDSIEYRMSDSPWLDIKYAFTRISVHDPGELAGAFLSEENVCNFTGYGKRVKFPFIPVSWGFYPHIVEATCTPVNGDNVDKVMQEMRALRLGNPSPE